MRVDHKADSDEKTKVHISNQVANDPIMQAILTSSPAEIDSLVDQHVVDLPSAREVIKRLCVAVRYLYLGVKK